VANREGARRRIDHPSPALFTNFQGKSVSLDVGTQGIAQARPEGDSALFHPGEMNLDLRLLAELGRELLDRSSLQHLPDRRLDLLEGARTVPSRLHELDHVESEAGVDHRAGYTCRPAATASPLLAMRPSDNRVKVKLACGALNTMAQLGMPDSYRVA
jgi:hypothetical protein